MEHCREPDVGLDAPSPPPPTQQGFSYELFPTAMLFANRLAKLNGASVLVYFSAWFLSFISMFPLMPAFEYFQ